MAFEWPYIVPANDEGQIYRCLKRVKKAIPTTDDDLAKDEEKTELSTFSIYNIYGFLYQKISDWQENAYITIAEKYIWDHFWDLSQN